MTDVETFFKQPKPERKPRKQVKAKRGGTAAALKRKATALHSEYVRARSGGRCERCNKWPDRLECAHIFSRRYAATRADEWNAWALCHACHRFLTENPYEHVLFATATRGEAGFMELREKAYGGVGKVMGASFWQGEVDRLQQKLEAMR